MKIFRIGVGGFLSIIGVFTWLNIIDDNTPNSTDTISISELWNVDVIIAMVIASIICGIGVWILGSGMRSSPTH